MRKLLACLLFVGNNERKIKMKSLITITTVVLLVGCGTTQLPKISIHEAVENGDIKTIKQHLAAGTDVNAAMVAAGLALAYRKYSLRYSVNLFLGITLYPRWVQFIPNCHNNFFSTLD